MIESGDKFKVGFANSSIIIDTTFEAMDSENEEILQEIIHKSPEECLDELIDGFSKESKNE